MGKQQEKPRAGYPVTIIIIVLLLAAGGGLLWYLEKAGAPPPEKLVLTPEAEKYMKNLKLSDVGMEAKESYMGQQVVEITGKISNNGDRFVKQIDLHCVFYDAYGQIVLRERVPIVKAATGGLKPGETKTFRLPFDSLAASWNQTLPQLVLKQIIFG
jgi:hypothetical protein